MVCLHALVGASFTGAGGVEPFEGGLSERARFSSEVSDADDLFGRSATRQRLGQQTCPYEGRVRARRSEHPRRTRGTRRPAPPRGRRWCQRSSVSGRRVRELVLRLGRETGRFEGGRDGGELVAHLSQWDGLRQAKNQENQGCLQDEGTRTRTSSGLRHDPVSSRGSTRRVRTRARTPTGHTAGRASGTRAAWPSSGRTL